jgi:competence protein CoiA
MLLAKRVSDGQIVEAYFENERNGPFRCPDCNELVSLRSGDKRVNYFAHVNPFACEFAVPESDAHLRCKLEIFEALQKHLNANEVAMERRLGSVRPDVFAIINGVPVAIEVQISSLSVETIMARTIEYHRKGIYVLWLLQWSPELDRERYAPAKWEKWVHACYFGRVYYWLRGLEVVEYRFEPSFRVIPRATWIDSKGKRQSVGGYAQRSVRFRRAVRPSNLNIATDFVSRNRFWWEGGGVKVPDAKLFMGK